MAGYKNESLRDAVRHHLRLVKHQRQSDRRIAHELGVHRQIVVEVRRQMIACGDHEPRDYKEHAAARGGYVWGDAGRLVRESDAIITAAGKLHPKAAATLTALLRVIRGQPPEPGRRGRKPAR